MSKKPIVRIEATNRLVKRIQRLTSKCFKESVIEILDAKDLSDEELENVLRDMRRAPYELVQDEYTQRYVKAKEKVDELYLVKLISLKTQDLLDVLFLHEHHQPRRAERTLEAITMELASRSLLNDSSQSDAIYNNGEKDVKPKGKPARKKASRKKRKTSKNR